MASYHRLRACALAVAGAAAVCAASGARADEAFLCGPDNVVYVKPSELEQKKKTDPCVARYYGLTVDAAPSGPQQPPQNGKAALLHQGAQGKTPVAFKALETPEKAERITPVNEQTAQLEPPVAAPGTDFRKVRVINASSPSEQWFKHTR